MKRSAEPSPRASLRRACAIATWANLGLAVFKMATGVVGYSSLLFIDGLASAGIGLVVATFLLGMQMSDAANVPNKYAYGQGKAQFLFALVVGTVLTIGAVITLALSFKRFLWPVDSDAAAVGLGVTILGLLVDVLVPAIG